MVVKIYLLVARRVADLREEPDPVFRSQADPCYPENSQRDGCYPDNAALPSRFMCWLTESLDRAPARGGADPQPKRSKGSKGSKGSRR
jgi:hypothetical protein